MVRLIKYHLCRHFPFHILNSKKIEQKHEMNRVNNFDIGIYNVYRRHTGTFIQEKCWNFKLKFRFLKYLFLLGLETIKVPEIATFFPCMINKCTIDDHWTDESCKIIASLLCFVVKKIWPIKCQLLIDLTQINGKHHFNRYKNQKTMIEN